ncbi:hypothetical protein ACQ4PT_053451 [Festuca glaucescens]
MAGWFDASYFHPPPVDTAPSWVLLNKMARYSNRDNDTTACAITSAGRTIKVSSSAKDLVLLRFSTCWQQPRDDEYFVYHAAAGIGEPSLRAVRRLPITQGAPHISSKITPKSPCVTLLPFGDDGGEEFILAYLTVVDHPVAYDLHVFSSKTCAWSTRALTPPDGVGRDDMPRVINKVIALGGSVLGWMDLHLGGGIIACDVLDEDPASTRFIPLPQSDFYKRSDRRSLAHRDVACYNDGFIVLVDLDLRFRYVALDRDDEKKPMIKGIKDLDHVSAILDSELICDGDQYVKVAHVPDGWKIRTCYRHISWDYWCTGHIVDVDDITVYDPRHCTLLSELWDGGAGRWTLRKLKAKRPTLSMQGGDVVYLTLVSKKGHNGRQSGKVDKQRLTIGIDLGKKMVEMLEPYSYDGDVQPFTLSQHVNGPPPQQKMWNTDDDYNGSLYGYANVVHADYGYDSKHPLLWSPIVP